MSFGGNSGFIDNAADLGSGVYVDSLSNVMFGDNNGFI